MCAVGARDAARASLLVHSTHSSAMGMNIHGDAFNSPPHAAKVTIEYRKAMKGSIVIFVK
jgi:hypothetical protein